MASSSYTRHYDDVANGPLSYQFDQSRKSLTSKAEPIKYSYDYYFHAPMSYVFNKFGVDNESQMKAAVGYKAPVSQSFNANEKVMIGAGIIFLWFFAFKQ